MEGIVISVAKDYSVYPGPRYRIQGKWSGEDFYHVMLRPKFLEALESKVNLIVKLDGVVGYGPSFLEESFGALAEEFGIASVMKTVKFESIMEPYLVEEINEYIKESSQRSTNEK